MANELRVRQNFVGGSVEDAPLAAAATTFTSAALAAVPVIGTTQHFPIILDPDGLEGAPEIAWITAHAANANTATLLRAQEGTAARLHYQDTPWVHGPLTSDVTGDTGWIAPVLGANIANYGSEYEPVGYRKDPAGFVHLRGLVTGTAVVSGAVIFTLPAGYRPLWTQVNVVMNSAGATRLDIKGTSSAIPGAVNAQNSNLTVTTGFLSLSIPPFLAEA
jgi:hypothetical protein